MSPGLFADDSDTNSVILAFQTHALQIVNQQTNEAQKSFLSGKINDTPHLYAKLTDFGSCHQRIDGTLSETERKNLILKGEISDLLRAGQCWLIQSFGGFGSEVCGYMTEDTKELVLFWIVPEG